MKATRDEMGKVYETFNNFFEMPVIKDDTADDTMDAKIREAAAGLTDQDVMDDDVQGILVKMGIKFPGQTVLDTPAEGGAVKVKPEDQADQASPVKPDRVAMLAAAKDMNENIDGLDPKIKTVAVKTEILESLLQKVGALVQPTDKISEDTRKVLAVLGVQVPIAAPEVKKRGRKPGVVKKEKAPKKEKTDGMGVFLTAEFAKPDIGQKTEDDIVIAAKKLFPDKPYRVIGNAVYAANRKAGVKLSK